MLRIVIDRSAARVTLEGQIIGPWVDELDRVCHQMIDGSVPVVLDLSAISFVSRAGVDLLDRLHARGVRVCNCSAFVREQIKAVAPSVAGGAAGDEAGR
jgi:hypothetical protein